MPGRAEGKAGAETWATLEATLAASLFVPAGVDPFPEVSTRATMNTTITTTTAAIANRPDVGRRLRRVTCRGLLLVLLARGGALVFPAMKVTVRGSGRASVGPLA